MKAIDLLFSFMSPKKEGQFAATLYSLQLQLKSLLEEAGGDHAVELLDLICTLNRSEQRIVLKVFKATLDRLVAHNVRFSNREDQALKKLEDNLYSDILSAYESANEEANFDPSQIERPLAVLQGGKELKGSDEVSNAQPDAASGLIDFTAALRTRRKPPSKPLLN